MIHFPQPKMAVFAALIVLSVSFTRSSFAQVYTWGDNSNGQVGNGTTANQKAPVTVNGLSGIQAISGGTLHTLALKSDGTVWAWGANQFGQLGNGSNSDSATPVQVPGLTSVKAIAAGGYHSMALLSDGTVKTWGYNYYGQLGNNSTTDSSTPVQVSGLTGIAAIASGSVHSLALDNRGYVFAWGDNERGELGIGSATNGLIPAQVNTVSKIRAIAGGALHSLALGSDGSVWAWGYNDSGQLGDGTNNDKNNPIKIFSGNIIAIAAGGFHSLFIDSGGNLGACGNNHFGQLGDGSHVDKNIPVPSSGTAGIKAISAGYYSSAALRSDGTVLTFGRNDLGELGNGTFDNLTHEVPTAISGLSGVSAISSGFWHCVAIVSKSTAVAWGRGILGDGSPLSGGIALVRQPRGVTAVAAGTSHFLSLHSDGTVWAWGGNYYGQLGDGSTTDRFTPFKISGLSGIVAVACGDIHSLALGADGTVWAWGSNDSYQVGVNSMVPVAVGGLPHVQAISAGSRHNLALASDGTVWAWGANTSGELGNGGVYSATRVQVHGPGNAGFLTGIKAISAGFTHNLALSADGAVWAWGANGDGQVGDGTSTTRLAPVSVGGALPGVIAVSCGDNHSLALTWYGDVFVWGRNDHGQLGFTAGQSQLTPDRLNSVYDITAIAGGGSHSAVIWSDGSVWEWGMNHRASLGDPSDFPFPVRVIEITSSSAITDGSSISIAIETNRPPVANAGPDQPNVIAVHGGDPKTDAATFTLDGTASYDPDPGDPISYQWTQKSDGSVVGTTASVTLTRTAVGGPYTFTLTVTDSEGLSSSDDVIVTVNPAPDDPPVAADQSVGTVQGTAVSIALSATDGDNDPLTYTVVSGPSSGTLTGTAPNYTYTPTRADFIGTDVFKFKASDKYADSNTATVTITVRDFNTTIKVPDVSGHVGDTVTLAATLTSKSDLIALPGKSVHILVGSTEVSGSPFTTDDAGKVSTTYTLDEGTTGSQITATFAGDSDGKAGSGTGTLTVSASDTTIVVLNASGNTGQTVNLSATLTRKSDGSGVATRNLKFSVGQTVVTSETDGSGVATINYKIPSSSSTADQTITVSFAGDGDYNASSGIGTLTVRIPYKLTLTVAPASPRIGATVTATVLFKSGNNAGNGEDIHIFLDGVDLGKISTDSTGKAILRFTAPEHVGSHQVIATFAGNGSYAPSSSKATISCVQALTKLTGETKTATAGANVDLGAKLTRTTDNSALIGKSVTFTIGTTTLTGTTDAGGRASVTLKAPARGKIDKYTVKFAGEADYGASTGTASVKGS